MDGNRFDTITQALGSSGTRRGVIGLLSVGAGLVLEAVSARKRNHNKHKNQNSKKHKHKQNKRKNNPSPNNGNVDVCKSAGSRACDPSQALSRADLNQCNLANAGLVGGDLSSAKAAAANFADAHLLGANLSSADLKNACFAGTSLRNADLRGSDVGGADFFGADLCGADLRGSTVTARQVANAAKVCCNTRLSDGNPALPCKTHQTCCESLCTDVKIDSGNCGACGNICENGKVCCAGQCVTPVQGGRCSGDSSCIQPSQDLQQVIDAAPDGGVINLCSGTWNLTKTLLISKGVSLFGPSLAGPSVLDGQGNIQVIGIRPNIDVTLGNVTITSGNAEQGAGIFNQGNLGLAFSEISQNRANLGGGIYNEGALYVYNSSIADNAALNESDEYSGGGIYNDQGTVILYGGATLVGNTANVRGEEFGMGGGIMNYYGEVTIKPDVELINNHAATHGGGIYNRAGQITIAGGSSITTNVAGNDGGGLYNEFTLGILVEIGNTNVVTGNTPNNCNASEGEIQNCIG